MSDEIPRLTHSMDEQEAKEKLQKAINLLHEIYSAIENTTIAEEVKAVGAFRDVLTIYRTTNGKQAIIDLASSDIPF